MPRVREYAPCISVLLAGLALMILGLMCGCGGNAHVIADMDTGHLSPGMFSNCYVVEEHRNVCDPARGWMVSTWHSCTSPEDGSILIDEDVPEDADLAPAPILGYDCDNPDWDAVFADYGDSPLAPTMVSGDSLPSWLPPGK
jgi:hypothetical protein